MVDFADVASEVASQVAENASVGRTPMAGCTISAAEATIEAWVSCNPQGYMLEEKRLLEVLPFVASKVPSTSRQRYDRMFEVLFVSPTIPIFSTLVKRRAGQIDFLSFWKAFSKAVRMASDVPRDSPLSELESFRDRVLQVLDTSPEDAISVAALSQEVQRAASMSAHPCFWQSASLSQDAHLLLHIEDVCLVLFQLLHECASLERTVAPPLFPFVPLVAGGEMACLPRPSVSMGPGRELSGLLRPYSPPHQVCIHVYDVSQESSIQKLNKVLAPASSQLKFGGIFHAGVEVNGLEWSFCSQEEVTKYGVECNQPKSHPNHHFRQTIKMGPTERSEEEIAKIIADMVEEYPGTDYDLLRRNCCHFADDLCQRLGVGCIPSWIYRLANVGAGVATLLETAKSVRHKVIGIPSVGSCSQFAPSRSRRNASCRIIDKVMEPNLTDLSTPKAAGIVSV